jgi:hypothetical protein
MTKQFTVANYTKMKYSLYHDVFTNMFYTTLLGGEFSNCHGLGSTPEGAVSSLKLRVNQLRNKIS